MGMQYACSIAVSFFLTYLTVETGSGYPGNCNGVYSS